MAGWLKAWQGGAMQALLADDPSQPLACAGLPACERMGCHEQTPWHWASHWVLEKAGLDGRQVVVDLGAGNNPILRKALSEHAKHAYLVDLVPPTRDGLPEHLVPVAASMDALPLPDASVDRVISVSSLEHLPHAVQVKTFQEAARVLKPGGTMAVTYGLLMRVGQAAAPRLATHPEFVARHCPAFVPLDIVDVLGQVPALAWASSTEDTACLTSSLPGGADFDEPLLLQTPGLCLGRYSDTPSLAADPDFAPIVWSELGLWLAKRGA